MTGASSAAMAVALGLRGEAGRQLLRVFAIEHELGAICEAARIVAGQREVRRECGIGAKAPDRRRERRADAFDVYATLRALREARALARRYVDARVRRGTGKQADDGSA